MRDIRRAHPKRSGAAIAHAMAIGALRYFLLRFTRSTVIAFDFKDALSFEGETGPYVQYAVVRVNGILRKGAELHPSVGRWRTRENCARSSSGEMDAGRFLAAPEDEDLWDLVLLAGSLDARVELRWPRRSRRFLARFAFELAQAFNVFYHKHHILIGSGCGEAGVFVAGYGAGARAVGDGAGAAGDYGAGKDVRTYLSGRRWPG